MVEMKFESYFKITQGKYFDVEMDVQGTEVSELWMFEIFT